MALHFQDSHTFAQHALIVAQSVAVQYVFSAFVGALEAPDGTSGKFYRFAFRFFNLLAANFKRSQLASNGANSDNGVSK
jgi:hypothetical protein